MKIWLIAPASGQWRHTGRRRLFNGKTFRFSMLSLLRVAAETPPEDEVRLIDEQIEDIPWEEETDLVGITCMTALAPRAYEIAASFRAKGVPVVLGGMHPTFRPQEALRCASAVVLGEAEGVWPKVVEDARRGRLQEINRLDAPPSLEHLKPPPLHLLRKNRYAAPYAIQAARGCPHHCAFCAVSAFHGGIQRRRPVADVLAEAAAAPSSYLLFVDDNLTADREYAAALFRGLTPLKKYWITQSTLALAEDSELVLMAAEAGCVGVFAGLESFSEKNLDGVGKNCHQAGRYREAIRTLHAHGIGVEAGIVFGFDGDGPGVFSRTLSLLDELEVDLIQASIFTPLPGTMQYQTMADRIVDRNWSHYDFHHVVFQPKGMSAEALQAGHDWVTREFYRPWRIARRLARAANRPRALIGSLYAAALNLAYYGRIRQWHIQGWNPETSSLSRHNPSIVQETEIAALQ
ncbi:MAG: radical SAM protein [Candidatus Omnitrophota bacterium]